MRPIIRFAHALLLFLAVAATTTSAGNITYYHNDIAGNPVAATNEQGQVIWRESYRPYGERTVNSAAALDNKIWFTSRRQDAETGLVYMGARYYDPVIGRFISMDPIGFDEKNLHSFNRYAYANNNPYKYVDPDGRAPFLLALVPILKSAATWGTIGFAATAGADAISQQAAFGAIDARGAAQEGLAAAPAWALGGAAGEAIAAARLAGAMSGSAKAGLSEDFFAGTRYSEKVVGQMKQGDHHAFPESVKGFQESGTVSKITGGDRKVRDMLKIPGEYRGKSGNFELELTRFCGRVCVWLTSGYPQAVGA